MLTGLVTTVGSIYAISNSWAVWRLDWWFGVSPEGIGFIFMLVAVVTGVIVALLSPPPPIEVQKLVEEHTNSWAKKGT